MSGVDWERYRRIEVLRRQLHSRHVYALSGGQYDRLAHAMTLARRCLDRDTHFQDIEQAIASVLGEIRPQFANRTGVRLLNDAQMRLLEGAPTPVEELLTDEDHEINQLADES